MENTFEIITIWYCNIQVTTTDSHISHKTYVSCKYIDESKQRIEVTKK
jgi:hypothetical protein